MVRQGPCQPPFVNVTFVAVIGGTALLKASFSSLTQKELTAPAESSKNKKEPVPTKLFQHQADLQSNDPKHSYKMRRHLFMACHGEARPVTCLGTWDPSGGHRQLQGRELGPLLPRKRSA